MRAVTTRRRVRIWAKPIGRRAVLIAHVAQQPVDVAGADVLTLT